MMISCGVRQGAAILVKYKFLYDRPHDVIFIPLRSISTTLTTPDVDIVNVGIQTWF